MPGMSLLAFAPTPGRARFRASQIIGFGNPGQDRVHRGEQICTGRPAEFPLPGTGGSDAVRCCLVREIRKFSPDEATAARRARSQP